MRSRIETWHERVLYLSTGWRIATRNKCKKRTVSHMLFASTAFILLYGRKMVHFFFFSFLAVVVVFGSDQEHTAHYSVCKYCISPIVSAMSSTTLFFAYTHSHRIAIYRTVCHPETGSNRNRSMCTLAMSMLFCMWSQANCIRKCWFCCTALAFTFFPVSRYRIRGFVLQSCGRWYHSFD